MLLKSSFAITWNMFDFIDRTLLWSQKKWYWWHYLFGNCVNSTAFKRLKCQC